MTKDTTAELIARLRERIDHTTNSTRAFLNYFNPAAMPSDVERQWLAVDRELDLNSAALKDTAP